eukprot:TRINITY_DN2179_c0_g3_i2.p1 TRINITY_DN2179_c0_g3~~TRINITY_DN2179_c0_g3_i2.p1  ORF type:complete len:851 (-),score=156.08 TRINITY_DN2179_c0_g3_i2:194-2746(-)
MALLPVPTQHVRLTSQGTPTPLLAGTPMPEEDESPKVPSSPAVSLPPVQPHCKIRNPLGGCGSRCARRACLCSAPLPYDLENGQPLRLTPRTPAVALVYSRSGGMRSSGDYEHHHHFLVHHHNCNLPRSRSERFAAAAEVNIASRSSGRKRESKLLITMGDGSTCDLGDKRDSLKRISMRRRKNSLMGSRYSTLNTGSSTAERGPANESIQEEEETEEGKLGSKSVVHQEEQEEEEEEDSDKRKRPELLKNGLRRTKTSNLKTPLEQRMHMIEMRGLQQQQMQRLKALEQEQRERFDAMPKEARAIIEEAFFDVVGGTGRDENTMLDWEGALSCCVELGLQGVNSAEKQDLNQTIRDSVIECAIVGLRWCPVSNMVVNVISDDNATRTQAASSDPPSPQVTLHEFALHVLPQVRHKLVELRSGELLREFFRHDINRDGTLSTLEVLDVARTLGLDQRVLLSALERDEDRCISFEVFQEAVSEAREVFERTLRDRERAIKVEENMDDDMFKDFRKDVILLADCFQRYDVDNTSRITNEEMMPMLKELGLMPSTLVECQEIEELVEQAEKEDAGMFQFKEFLILVKSIREHRQERIRDEQLKSFEHYDKDHGGDLSVEEISMLLLDLGIAPRNRTEQAELATMIHAADEDGSGTIDFMEFQDLCQRIDEKLKQIRYEQEIDFAMSHGFTEAQMRDFRWVFDTLDVEGSERLSLTDVHSCLSAMHKNISWETVEATYQRLECDGDGDLDFLEFLELMQLMRDNEGLFSEDLLTLEPYANRLELRILRRSLEQFRIAKLYLIALNRTDLIRMFCEYIGVHPTENIHKALNISTVHELFQAAKQRNIAMQHNRDD